MYNDDDLLEAIRADLRQRIHEAGLRPTAREVGMSATGLRALVDGSNPYIKTWNAILEWHALHRARPPALDARTAHNMLLTLTRHLPAERRYPLIRDIEALLRLGGAAPPEPGAAS